MIQQEKPLQQLKPSINSASSGSSPNPAHPCARLVSFTPQAGFARRGSCSQRHPGGWEVMLVLPTAPSPSPAAGHGTEGPGVDSPNLLQTVSMRNRVYVDGCPHPTHLCSYSKGRGAAQLETQGAVYSLSPVSHTNTAQSFSAQRCVSRTLQ